MLNRRESLLLLIIKITMEEEILKKLEEQEKKIEAIYVSVEKTRKYFLWTLIITVVAIVLPLIGLVFAIPYFLDTILGTYKSLGL